MKYAEVSDVDLYHGNMRFDVNVSVSKDPKKFGKRTETKNLNSFRSVENAVLYEIDRQIERARRRDVKSCKKRGAGMKPSKRQLHSAAKKKPRTTATCPNPTSLQSSWTMLLLKKCINFSNCSNSCDCLFYRHFKAS
jgi:hypothetical protein